MTQILHKTAITLTYPSGRTENINLSYTDTSITEIRNQEIVIPISTTITLWDTSDTSENIKTLAYAYLQNNSAGTLEYEFVVDDDGSVGEELHTGVIPAGGHVDLLSNIAYANHSAGDAFAGTKDVIERIRIKEPNGVVGSLHFILGGS